MHASPRRRIWRVWGLRLFGVLGLAFMVGMLVRALGSDQEVTWPGVPAVLAAGVLAVVAMTCAAEGWVRLIDDPDNASRLRVDFFRAQLGKYVPGGAWQQLGMVGLATERGITPARAAAATVGHIYLQVTAGCLLAIPFALRPTAPWWVRLLVFGGLLAVVAAGIVATRPAPTGRLAFLAMLFGDLRKAGTVLGLLAANSAAQGVAFALLADVPAGEIVTVAMAFAAAWTAGFLALPFPGGIGVREAALVDLVAVASGTVLAASIVLRAVTGVVELVVIAVRRGPR
jgi:hypothetical protein